MRLLNWYQLSRLHDAFSAWEKTVKLAATYDFDSVDWSRPTADIARDLGVDPNYISHRRRHYAPDTIQKQKPHKPTGIDWGSPLIDWTQSDREIAEHFGIKDLTIVHGRRMRYAPETADKWFNWRQVDWATVDWDKSNDEIGGLVGCSPYTIARVRERIFPGQTWEHTEWGIHQHKGIDWKKVDWNKPSFQLAKELNVSSATVWQQRKRYAPHTLKNPPPIAPISLPKIRETKPSSQPKQPASRAT
jgi:hypothetical protein